MLARQLRTDKEKALFVIGAIYSAQIWLLLVITIIGIFYGVFLGIGILIAQAIFLAHVRGNGVRIGPEQLPDLHAKIVRAAQKLGLPRPPEAYVVHAGGVLNAFATKLLSRNFVILNAELLDACEQAKKRAEDGAEGEQGEDVSAIDFIIGHEIGHLAAGHLTWNLFLIPARLIPLFGPAYSRACEYTCDRCGHAVAGDLEVSSRALAILAAGGRYGRRVDLAAFVEQRREASDFFLSVVELNLSHPYLPKRVAALHNFIEPGRVPAVERNLLAYPLAPFFGFAGGGGAHGSIIVIVVVIILLAVSAIPAFIRYMEGSGAASRSAAAGMYGGDEDEQGDDADDDSPGYGTAGGDEDGDGQLSEEQRQQLLRSLQQAMERAQQQTEEDRPVRAPQPVEAEAVEEE